MKQSIVKILLENAVEHMRSSLSAHRENNIPEEIRHSISAHLMAALALEGFANQISENVLDKWVWRRIEKMDTPLKWHFISGLNGLKPFGPPDQPLQIVQKLHSIRNRLVHPKIMDVGDEIIVLESNGNLRRNVPIDEKVKDGDTILVGYGKLFDEFNSSSAQKVVECSINAVKQLIGHLSITGLEWVDNFKEG